MKFPAHKAGLHLSHNEHLASYETVEGYIASSGERFDFKDTEARQRAIETGELWVLQWYPDTPVGFCAAAAPTLEELFTLANGEV